MKDAMTVKRHWAFITISKRRVLQWRRRSKLLVIQESSCAVKNIFEQDKKRKESHANFVKIEIHVSGAFIGVVFNFVTSDLYTISMRELHSNFSFCNALRLIFMWSLFFQSPTLNCFVFNELRSQKKLHLNDKNSNPEKSFQIVNRGWQFLQKPS